MDFEFKDWDWKSAGKVTLAENIFDAPLRKDIIARVIKWQRAKSRAGTHSTKTFSMVSGTTRKPWAQKETGRARQGSLRAPHFRGGAIVFGPHPRDYEYKLNKKVRTLGCVSSLTFKLKEGLFDVVKNFDAPFTKTSAFDDWMKERGFKSVLFVLDDKLNDEAFFRCIRNVPYCDVIPVRGLNVLDIVKHKNIVCDLESLKAIEERFGSASFKGDEKFSEKALKENASLKAPKVTKDPKAVKVEKVVEDTSIKTSEIAAKKSFEDVSLQADEIAVKKKSGDASIKSDDKKRAKKPVAKKTALEGQGVGK